MSTPLGGPSSERKSLGEASIRLVKAYVEWVRAEIVQICIPRSFISSLDDYKAGRVVDEEKAFNTRPPEA
jgi:hypothetical protein